MNLGESIQIQVHNKSIIIITVDVWIVWINFIEFLDLFWDSHWCVLDKNCIWNICCMTWWNCDISLGTRDTHPGWSCTMRQRVTKSSLFPETPTKWRQEKRNVLFLGLFVESLASLLYVWSVSSPNLAKQKVNTKYYR